MQARRSRVRFPMVSLEFFIDIIHSPHYGPGVDSVSNTNEKGEGGGRYHLHVPIVLKSGNLNLLEPTGSVQRLLYVFVFMNNVKYL